MPEQGANDAAAATARLEAALDKIAQVAAAGLVSARRQDDVAAEAKADAAGKMRALAERIDGLIARVRATINES